MHTAPKPIGRGWKVVGYSDMIHLNGDVTNLVPYNNDEWKDPWEITNGAYGYNRFVHHVVIVGGCAAIKQPGMKYYPPKDTRTPEQNESLEDYVKDFLCIHPDVRVIGHNEVANKACPSFDVGAFCRKIGIPEKNIGR